MFTLGDGVTDASVLCLILHEDAFLRDKFKFNKTIWLVRDPYEALVSEFNRFQPSAIILVMHPLISLSLEVSKKIKSHVYDEMYSINNWTTTNTHWFDTVPPASLHVVYYDQVVSDTQNVLKKGPEFFKHRHR